MSLISLESLYPQPLASLLTTAREGHHISSRGNDVRGISVECMRPGQGSSRAWGLAGVWSLEGEVLTPPCSASGSRQQGRRGAGSQRPGVWPSQCWQRSPWSSGHQTKGGWNLGRQQEWGSPRSWQWPASSAPARGCEGRVRSGQSHHAEEGRAGPSF